MSTSNTTSETKINGDTSLDVVPRAEVVRERIIRNMEEGRILRSLLRVACKAEARRREVACA